jgi:hypothetical protein
MTLTALRDDALTSVAATGMAVRVSLPWIRSLPLAGLTAPALTIDGDAAPFTIVVGDRTIEPGELRDERGWWFVQDRVVLHTRRPPTPGTHDVGITFGLDIPYLDGGPSGPLRLPFSFQRSLRLDATPPTESVSRDVA